MSQWGFIIRYGISGVLAASVQVLVLYVWVSVLGLQAQYLLGVVLGFCCGSVVGFFLQKYWTFAHFPHHHAPRRQFVLYVLVGLAALGLNALLLNASKLLLEAMGFNFFHIWYLVAQVVVIFLVAVLSFLFNKFVTFKSSLHSDDRLPMLWFLTGTIGDSLMAFALCNEIAELNPGITSTLFVRREPQLVKDLAKLVPSVSVEAASFAPSSLWHIAVALTRRWQIMSAWHSVGLRKALRGLFLLNPGTRIARFDYHQPATSRDMVATSDSSRLFIDHFRTLAQTAGFTTRVVGSPASLPIASVMPRGFMLEPGSYIVLHPFGSSDFKSLPAERCRSILKALAAAYPRFSFVVTSSVQDSPAAHALVEGLPRAQAAVGLPILEVAGLIQNAALYIGVDTGITHLAAMMGKETLALEHTTYPHWYPLYNPKTTLLLSDPSDTREGVWGVSNAAVLAAAAKELPA